MLRVPAYERLRLQVKQAALEMGLDIPGDIDTWSAKLVIAADGSEQAGLVNSPWYLARFKSIRNFEGGRPAIVETITALALCLLRDNPSLDYNAAALEASNEWRKSIRAQWDYRAGDNAPLSIEHKIERVRKRVPGHDDTADDFVHNEIGLTVEHPANIEDPEREEVRLLRQGCTSILSDNERLVVDMRSGGMSYQAIADEMGWYGRQSAYATFNRAVGKLRDYITEGMQ